MHYLIRRAHYAICNIAIRSSETVRRLFLSTDTFFDQLCVLHCQQAQREDTASVDRPQSHGPRPFHLYDGVHDDMHHLLSI